MKRIAVMAAVLCLTALGIGYGAECNSRCCDEEYPKLVAYGQGKIEIAADKAYFNIRMRTEEKSLERAFEESAKRINALQQKLVAMGIKKEDIRNLGYIYHPLYEGKNIFSTIARPTSYEVIYTLRITLYALDTLGKTLANLSEITETSVYGLTYTSTKIEELKRDVLKEAALDAKLKAAKLAEGSGATLGKVLKIQTGTEVYPETKMLLREDRLEASSFRAKSIVTPEVESGYIEVMGNVTVVYAVQ